MKENKTIIIIIIKNRNKKHWKKPSQILQVQEQKN